MGGVHEDSVCHTGSYDDCSRIACMVSRENAVVLTLGTVALFIGYGGLWLTDLGTNLLIGTILFVGVVAPQLVNGYLDRKQEE